MIPFRPVLIVFIALASSLLVSQAHAAEPPKAWSSCASCHSLKAGENKAGPSLHNLIGRPAGSAEGFSYSPAVKNAKLVWDEENLDKFLKNPRQALPGNRMFFGGIPNDEQRHALIEFLKTASK